MRIQKWDIERKKKKKLHRKSSATNKNQKDSVFEFASNPTRGQIGSDKTNDSSRSSHFTDT